MSDPSIDPIEFGALRAEVAAQRRDLDNMVRQLAAMETTISSLRDTLTEARGGWRTLMWLGGAAAAAGAAMSWAVNHLTVR